MPHYFVGYGTGDDVDATNLNSRLTDLDDQIFALASGSGYEDQAANLVLAGPASGADAAPTFRALVADDLAAAYEDQPANLVFAGPASGADDTPTFRALVTNDLAAALVDAPEIGAGTQSDAHFNEVFATGLRITDDIAFLDFISTTGGAFLNVDAASGEEARLAFRENSGQDFWYLSKDDAGDMILNRYVAGVWQDQPLIVRNATGNLVLGLAGAQVGFFASAGSAKPTITGSRGGVAALTSLMSALAALGLVTNSTSA